MSLRAALRYFATRNAGASSLRAASTAAAAAPTPPTEAEELPSMESMRTKARRVYKELHRLGRDYPDPEYNFNMRLRRAFEKNANITDPVKLKQQLDLAEHIKKEILAMYSIRKYRHLRRAYHPNEAPREFHEDFALPDDKRA
ncbi:hypothetical protein CC85DRAFT_286860 [Cutaneotrichosporon oleaginosum]|uniref:Complex 1 LYR protein domain-containing protein n=1 Tax=Cutaneotrichosporon oleaginosum TaxID=879819 RepID=A0A0J0XIZ9_9TREE|nr:uncharacterized protein CC85DRAFT_286860 [Cutaneotrichosporon oleaginosum]KLT41052.1 hypothetical protein CC85DRAFT_286860 [Cutaneotrichosporon oleaginosum]TXT12144.1 hypothetical protein COLE_02554 [Cutaneotrichosporon oleaginosum]